MIALDDIQRGWHFAEQRANSGTVPAQILDGVSGLFGQPLLAVHEQQRHLLIPITGRRQSRGDQTSAGIHLLVNEWGIDNEQKLYADVVCLKPHLNDLFDLVIFDICSALSASETHPVDICRQVLDQWRELLGRDHSALPDTHTIVGLFGELWMLRTLTQQHERAVDLWCGPTGARHDFSNGRTALEVKASQQRRGRFVTIHGHDQLEPPQDGSLYLVLLQVEEAPSGGESLANIVQGIIALGGDSYQLMRRLAYLDVTATVLTQINGMQFLVRRCDVYRVDESFPRIVSQSFSTGTLPRGVVSLTYQIDLSSPPPAPLSVDDAEAVYQAITGLLTNGNET